MADAFVFQPVSKVVADELATVVGPQGVDCRASFHLDALDELLE